MAINNLLYTCTLFNNESLYKLARISRYNKHMQMLREDFCEED